MTRDLTDDRLALGLGAVLSLSAAARLLPVSDADARSWLRARGLVSDLDGRAVVVWQRVCAALAAGVRAFENEHRPSAAAKQGLLDIQQLHLQATQPVAVGFL